MAKQLKLPVLLVIDAKGMSGSCAPMVSGFVSYAQETGVSVVGVIANRVGSKYHAGLLKDILQ